VRDDAQACPISNGPLHPRTTAKTPQPTRRARDELGFPRVAHLGGGALAVEAAHRPPENALSTRAPRRPSDTSVASAIRDTHETGDPGEKTVRVFHGVVDGELHENAVLVDGERLLLDPDDVHRARLGRAPTSTPGEGEGESDDGSHARSVE
jgi:hypothetical protein